MKTDLSFKTETNTIVKLSDEKLKYLKKKIYKLNLMYLKSNEKVAYYYEDINTHTVINYNPNILFYAASSIKILVSLLLYRMAEKKEVDLEEEILITSEDLKPGTGVIRFQEKDKSYTIRELIKYNIIESDNTAYIKLVNYVGKDKLIEFGKSLGAKHTLEGKDLFGLINCEDMAIYWKEIYKFIDESKYAKEFSEYLKNPSFKIINEKNIGNNEFERKYGGYDIAFHEAGIVRDENPYVLIILTQKFKKKGKYKFINETAKQLYKIHKYINEKG